MRKGNRGGKSKDGRAPVLLTHGEMSGTLAAARALGRDGVPVTLASRGVFESARWSRSVRRRATYGVTGARALLEWHLAFGREHPGHVLLPSNDETAWLYARFQDALAADYLMRVPPVEAIEALLFKGRLHGRAERAGIATLPWWLPASPAELDSVPAAAFPVVVKPQCAIFAPGAVKGVVAHDRAGLERAYARAASATFDPVVTASAPDVRRPIVQRYVEAESVLSVAAFVRPGGEIHAARFSRKLLQQPPGAGVGVCFESAAPVPELLPAIERLCAMTGYFGVVEAEFVRHGGDYCLIDFNPRFYNELALDIARGLALPRWSYELALGEPLSAPMPDAAMPMRWVDRWNLELLLWRHRFSGDAYRASSRWRGWLGERQGRRVSAVFAWDDPLPGVVQMATSGLAAIRSPRWFWEGLR